MHVSRIYCRGVTTMTSTSTGIFCIFVSSLTIGFMLSASPRTAPKPPSSIGDSRSVLNTQLRNLVGALTYANIDASIFSTFHTLSQQPPVSLRDRLDSDARAFCNISSLYHGPITMIPTKRTAPDEVRSQAADIRSATIGARLAM